MTHATTILLAPTSNRAHLHGAQFLARYSGTTRELYGTRLRIFFDWCELHGRDPISLDPDAGISRPLLELYSRHLEEERGNAPASVAGALSTIKMFYRLLAVDQVIASSPAEYVRMPRIYQDETRVTGLTRMELGAFIATARTMGPDQGALAVMLGLLGLRVSEACAVRVGDFSDYERDHRVLRVVGKGGKRATMPLPPPVFRELDRCAQGREGQLLHNTIGGLLDRKTGYRMVKAIAKRTGLKKHVHPHALRHSFVTAALDAGVPLRDVQIAARHSDPRTTNRYDRARHNLDRHANHTVAAFIAGGA